MTLQADIRHAFLGLKRAPALSVVVILTLALGVGGSAALLTLLNAFVLKPLEIGEPARLVTFALAGTRGQPVTIPMGAITELRRRQRSFSVLCGYTGGGLLLTEMDGIVGPLTVELADGQYFDLLGVRPFLGRLITPADVPSNGELVPVAVLGYGFWQRQLRGDATIVGRTIRLKGNPVTIVGVTPPGFSGMQVDVAPDVTAPIPLLRHLSGGATALHRPIQVERILGYLRPGVTLEQARAEILALWPSVQTDTMPVAFNADERALFLAAKARLESAATGLSTLRDRYGHALSLLVALSAVLVVLACANLGGLLVARTTSQELELSVRAALGASPSRLVRQALVDSIVLSVLGIALAIPFGWWLSEILAAWVWTGVSSLTRSVAPDLRLLGTLAAASIVIGILIGLPQAYLIGRRARSSALHSSRTMTRRSRPWVKGLLIVQVGLSLGLVVGAGTLTRSVQNLGAIDLGFDTTNVLLSRFIALPGGYQTLDEGTYYPELVRRLEAIPGVKSVSLSHIFPIPLPSMLAVAPTSTPPAEPGVSSAFDVVSPGFFDTVGISLVAGRKFQWSDGAGSPAVAIINSALAQRLFPNGGAMGQHVRIGLDLKRTDIEIVGIVADAKQGNIREAPVPAIFRPTVQEPQLARVPLVQFRIAKSATNVADDVRRVVPALGREYVASLVPLGEQVRRTFLQETMAARLASVFALVALVLAAVGLYGLISHRVSSRARDIGIRMALGAARRRIVTQILVDTTILVSIGIMVGICLTVVMGQYLRSMLFGLSPFDPWIVAAATGVFLVFGFCSAALPARQASRIDLLAALRQE